MVCIGLARNLGGLGVIAAFCLLSAGCSMQSGVDPLGTSSSGLLITVHSGQSLQAAIDSANLGDEIRLDTGGSYGPINLPNKSGSGGYITIQIDPSKLPAKGTRLDPNAYGSVLAKISCPNSGSSITTSAGAHHFIFRGIEFTPPAKYAFNHISLEAPNQNSLSQVPHDLIFNQIYAHTSDAICVRRAFWLNSGATEISDSYIAGYHDGNGLNCYGSDSQAIGGANGPGPYKVLNNYLEAATENVIFGGQDPAIANLVPGQATWGAGLPGIQIERNTFFKPLRWKGAGFVIKNLLELKNAMNVRINGNIFQNNWGDGQSGMGILFTVRNQSLGCPWCTVQNVDFTNNSVDNTVGGISLLGKDDCQDRPPNCLSVEAQNITIANNLFTNMGQGNPFLQLFSGNNIVVDHNDAFPNFDITRPYGPPTTGFKLTNNFMKHGEYGLWVEIPSGSGPGGSGCPAGNGYPIDCSASCVPTPTSCCKQPPPKSYTSSYLCAVDYHFPSAIITHDVVLDPPYTPPTFVNIGPPGPAGNVFATPNVYAASSSVGFTDYAGGKYRLTSSSPYHNAATDGKDIGVDMDALLAAQAGNGPPPPPTGPTVSITSPAANSTVSGTAVALAVSVTGTVNSVKYLLDGTAIGTSSTAPYGATWNSTTVNNGSHTLVAEGDDASGKTLAQSSPVAITVSNGTAPKISISITSPTDGSTVSGTIAAVAAVSGSGASGVNFYVDNAFAGAGTAGANSTYSFNWNTTSVSDNVHTLVAQVLTGVTVAAISNPVRVTVKNHAPPPPPPPGPSFPMITIAGLFSGGVLIAPPEGATVSGTVIAAFTTETTGNETLAGVQLYCDSNLIGSNTQPFSISFDSKQLTDGPHQLIAKARDTAGNVGTSATVDIIVKNGSSAPPPRQPGPPSGFSVTSPADKATISASTTFKANVPAGQNVDFLYFVGNGVPLRCDGKDRDIPTADADAPTPAGVTYEMPCDTTQLLNGRMQLAATYFDKTGNQFTSPAIAVDIENASGRRGSHLDDGNSQVSGQVSCQSAGSSGPTLGLIALTLLMGSLGRRRVGRRLTPQESNPVLHLTQVGGHQ